MFIVVIIILLISVAVLGFQFRANTKLSRYGMSIYGGTSKKSDLDEQFRIQQEMLARRKNPKAKEANFKKVEERREAVAKTAGKTLWSKKTKDGIDPLNAWKAAKDRGDVKDLGYTPEPPKDSSLFGINIPIPMSPIDVPQYDNGQRFDLRLPYAERGYEDEDADVMGKMAKAFGGFFGKGDKDKKKEDEGNQK